MDVNPEFYHKSYKESSVLLIFYKYPGPPMVKALPQHLYAVLGEKFKIMCNATNDQDAPMNLTFSWKTPDGVHFNITTTTEDNNRKAISTLHISSVTNGHDGMYKCTVSNGKHQGNNVAISSLLVVEGKILLLYA